MTSRIVLKVKLAAASHKVHLADSFEKLLELSASVEPELIIIPTSLGSFTAPRICRVLRSRLPTAQTPIILISDNLDQRTRIESLKSGADDIVDLPFHDPLLLGRVRNALRAAATLAEVKKHEEVALELGLGENGAGACAGTKICLVERETTNETRLSTLLSGQYGSSAVCRVSHDEVLDGVQTGRCHPDAFVISAHGLDPETLLQTTAEIRSHPVGRQSVITLFGSEECATTVSALDVGASDLLPQDIIDDEILLRIENQLSRKRHFDSLKALVDRGLKLATTDPLTGLFNRRYATYYARKIAANAIETEEPFAVLILDIDHFKNINDTHGHGAGDAVLQTFAARLEKSIRRVDLLSRIGGEEFLIIMPNTNIEQASSAAERLKSLATGLPIPLPPDGRMVELTISIGLVVGTPGSKRKISLDDLMSMADKALLASKAAGRNLVTISQTAA